MNRCLGWKCTWPIAALAFVSSLGWLCCTEARAVQASGFLRVVPSNWGTLRPGDEIDIALRVENRSSHTPIVSLPEFDPVAAQLAGVVTVKLACLDPACSGRGVDVLEFVPAGGNGCASSHPAVTACVPAEPGIVQVHVPSLVIPPQGNVELATIHARVVSLPFPELQPMVRASTGPASLFACIVPPDQGCVGVGLTGAAQLAFSTPTVPPTRHPLRGCEGGCPSKIRFATRAERLDLLELHGVVALDDPAFTSGRFAVSLANTGHGTIFVTLLPPAAILARGGLHSYDDPGARRVGGVEHLRIAPLEGEVNVYRVDLRAFGSFADLATERFMTATMVFGETEFAVSADWAPKAFGWQVDLP